MAERARAIEVFLEGCGWGAAARSPLAGDASFRRYVRLERGGDVAMLMDAPPPMEDVRPFARIARHLRALGYSAPEILARDDEAGLLLLEDFGDDTYTALLASGADETALYSLAVDVLIDLHKRPLAEAVPDRLPAYDDALLLEEAELFTGWYLPAVLGDAAATTAAEEFRGLWRELLPLARAVPDTLVLRDYHVDNLIRLPGRQGIEACGLLDFQDAVRGPVSYDLMSLLEDARRDIAPPLAGAMQARYRAAFPSLDTRALDISLAVLGAQRHCKVIGIFTRLSVRDAKPAYLAHIPRVWRLLENALADPALEKLLGWMNRHVPGPARRIPG